MQKLISDNLNTIKSLCASHNVNKLYVFGSVCTDKFNEKSDIDYFIPCKDIIFELKIKTIFLMQKIP